MHAKNAHTQRVRPVAGNASSTPNPNHPRPALVEYKYRGKEKGRRPGRNRDGAPRGSQSVEPVQRVTMARRERLDNGHQRAHRRRAWQTRHHPPSTTARDAFEPETPARTGTAVTPPPPRRRGRQRPREQRQTPGPVPVVRVPARAQRQPVRVTEHDAPTATHTRRRRPRWSPPPTWSTRSRARNGRAHTPPAS